MKEDEAMYINNAGLVILNPYLSRYFKMLNMIEEGVFTSENNAARATLLLHYLVSGQTECPEHLLVFNKVICGLAVETPVPGSIELTQEEADTSEQLLNVVLQNWDKMSTSTVENLRASFLLRDGKLTEHGEHWGLQVEEKGFDIILSFIPWTISHISLPWIEKRVEVDWKTSMT